MAELMGDPRDPNAHDGAPTAVDDAPALVLETAPVDTSVAAGGDAAAAREAAAHFAKGGAHLASPRHSRTRRSAKCESFATSQKMRSARLHGTVKQMAEWLMLTCEEAGADAEELC